MYPIRITAGLLGVLGLAACLHAQEIMDPKRGAATFSKLEEQFEASRHDKRAQLRGRIMSVHVALDLGFRFQAGCLVEAPLAQFEGRQHQLSMYIRVQSEAAAEGNGKPEVTYLFAGYTLPLIPRGMKGNTMNFGGLFFLGEGTYKVDTVVTDDENRILRRSEKVHAALKGAEKQIRPLTPPGRVATLSSLRFARRGEVDGPPLRVTVLLHAAPSFWRSTVLRPQDVSRLLASLSAMLTQVNVSALRVVAFNLDQQKELYRRDNFRPRAFVELQRAIQPLQLGTIDIRVLQNARGHMNLLADLLNSELEADQPVDAIVIMGPTSRSRDSLRSGMVHAESANHPPVFYFQYRSPREMLQSEMPDVIESAVKRAGGRTFHVFTPGDFAKAIAEVAKVSPAHASNGAWGR